MSAFVRPIGHQAIKNPIEISLLGAHGELMTGADLRRLLRMNHERAFRRAAAAGRLPVSVFRLPGRKGWFARTRDVAAWLASIDVSAICPGDESTPASMAQLSSQELRPKSAHSTNKRCRDEDASD